MGTKNERNAGRKPTLTADQLEVIRKRRENGETVTNLAKEFQVSRQTLSGYLNEKNEEMEQICRTIRKWIELNRRFKDVRVQDYTLRMDYMCDDEYCTTILVNFREEKIAIINETDDIIHRAFGVKVKPTWEDFQYFLKDRCVPETRDHLRMVLRDMGLDFYDPMAIIEKTAGRMAEDHQWIKLTYLRVE